MSSAVAQEALTSPLAFSAPVREEDFLSVRFFLLVF